MKFCSQIPLSEIRVGDFFRADIECLKDRRRYTRRCRLVQISGPVLRVSTRTRKGLIAITRKQIVSEYAWGDRP